LDAAKALAEEGIECEIIDLRSLQPLDMTLAIESFKKTNRAVVVEFGHKVYGIGSEVVSQLQEDAFDYIDAPIKRVAQEQVPPPFAGELEKSLLPNAQKVIDTIKEIL